MRRLTLLAIAVLFPCMALALTTEELQSQIDTLLLQLSQLQSGAQTQNQTNTNVPVADGKCPQITRTLSRGAKGEDVRSLQTWLRATGFLKADATGYFGNLTEKAVQEYQRYERIVLKGTPGTTGWGVVGPKTRDSIRKRCSLNFSFSQPKQEEEVITCAAAPTTPSTACDGEWVKVLNSNSCHVGWHCQEAVNPNSHNQSPVIQSIDGPSKVGVNRNATWFINATDPEGGALKYAASWGDEDSGDLLSILAGNTQPAYSSSRVLTHYFANEGTYSPEFMVRDAVGNVTSASVSVTVEMGETGPTGGTTPPPSPNSCGFGGAFYPEGTETEGHSVNDLCVATGGKCQPPSAYYPKFKCAGGSWVSTLTNPYPGLPLYGNVIGGSCGSNNATMEVAVAPNTQLCRNLLCAIAQNYAKISLRCAYTNWVDSGLFRAGATTTSVCSGATPCEYTFGDQGRACAAKQNGQCPVPTNTSPVQ